MHEYWSAFSELIRVPFQHVELIWGIVPLYFGLLLSELTSTKANYQTALQTGFSFLWAGAQWLYPYFRVHGADMPELKLGAMLPVNLAVTFVVIGLGVTAIICGLRRKFPRYGRFIGHTRFANYFTITLFPLQTHYLKWDWPYVAAIGLFALPVWLVLHFGLMPIRNRY